LSSAKLSIQGTLGCTIHSLIPKLISKYQLLDPNSNLETLPRIVSMLKPEPPVATTATPNCLLSFTTAAIVTKPKTTQKTLVPPSKSNYATFVHRSALNATGGGLVTMRVQALVSLGKMSTLRNSDAGRGKVAAAAAKAKRASKIIF
jgi:hypothetical protein